MKKLRNLNLKSMIILGLVLGIVSVGYFGLPIINSVSYNNNIDSATPPENKSAKAIELLPPKEAIHLKTPQAVKGIYMTSWAAGTPSMRKHLIKIADETEINSIVIDIKDYTGRIAFSVSDPFLAAIGSSENRVPDIFNLIDELHQKNIYVIGRIAVFQDLYLIKKKPNWAVKKFSDKSVNWVDKKGIGWLDAGNKEVWNYTIAIAKEAYRLGFDELNFDYIRFPSDGNMKDIFYPFSDGKVKAEVMESFFQYLNENLKGTGAILSADLFGMTMTNADDLNIGQLLEKAVPYFDFIGPMVYPSHYPPTWNGFKNPADHPYEVVKIALKKGTERLTAIEENPLKLRPWLQDFDLGATYDKEKILAEIKATYDVGLNSWILWDPKNLYTVEALAARRVRL